MPQHFVSVVKATIWRPAESMARLLFGEQEHFQRVSLRALVFNGGDLLNSTRLMIPGTWRLWELR